MTKLAQSPTDIGIVLPLALTQLYFESLDLWPLGQSHGISYSCAFEDCPNKISKMAPDIHISLTDVKLSTANDPAPQIYAKRMIVASPNLLGETLVMTPVDLTSLPYATLCRNDRKHYRLRSSTGARVTVQPERFFEGNDLFAAYEAARQGIAFAILPEWMVREDIMAGQLVRLLPGWTPTPKRIHISISSQCANQSKANMLANLMMEKMKSIPGIDVHV